MKIKVFGWLILGCILYVCPNAMAQSAVISSDIIGSSPDQPIAGVPSGTAPWVVTSGSITISSDGNVQGKIKKLIILGVGVGPVTKVAASLVCGGMVVATTSSFPLKQNGNVNISDTIHLPDSCLAPIVLIRITALNGDDLPNPINYIASTGFTTNTAHAQNSAQESKDGGPNK